MTWPSAKATEVRMAIHRLPPAQAAAERDRRRRLAARGLCAKCEVNPRASNMTICNPCHGKTAHKVRAKKVEDAIRQRGCAKCGGWVETLRTSRGRPRYVCYPCFKQLSHDYRMNGGMRPKMAILHLMMNLNFKGEKNA